MIDSIIKATGIAALADPIIGESTSYLQGCTTGNCSFSMENGITHSTIGMC